MMYKRVLIIVLSTLIFSCSMRVAGQSDNNTSENTSDMLRTQIKSDQENFHKIKNSENSKEQIISLKSIGAGFQRLNEFDSAIYYYEEGAEIALETDSKDLYSSLLYNLGLVYLNIGLYQQALDYSLQALTIDKELNNADDIAASLNAVALVYQEWGIYDKSLSYRLESIKVSEENNNEVEIANGNYNLGNLYSKIGKADKALGYFQLAESNYKDLLKVHPVDNSLKQGLSECIYSIGGIHLYKKEYQQALSLFNDALKIKHSLSDKLGLGNCYYQIGLINSLREDYESARQNLFMALQYKNLIDDKKGIALVYYRIGDVYLQQGKLSQSETFIHKSIKTALEIGDKEILMEDYKILYQIYSAKKKYKEALNFHQLYKAYTDSIKNESTTKIVEELSVRYETDKKEKENEILLRGNEIKTLTIQKQKSLGLFLVGVLVLVVLIGIILYVLYRSKRKTNKIISHKNKLLGEQNIQIVKHKKEIEHKNINLTASIVYAKRIQDAMLSDVKKLNEILDDAFILFKPKDIVSGDFYWFGQKDDKFILAAIDCTGHGVPGAFMSMLGNSFLNQIVFNWGITSPEIILDKLSSEVQNALKQAETNNQDGMDMAICTIDLKTKSLEFAGAKNPLVYIKNGIAERIKGSRLPIGISYDKESSFEKHLIEAGEPTCFYMFSDGYADQFGGPKASKFMIKKLQSLLVEIHKKPMETQKEILDKSICEWMKDEDQIDDILVIGFKMG